MSGGRGYLFACLVAIVLKCLMYEAVQASKVNCVKDKDTVLLLKKVTGFNGSKHTGSGDINQRSLSPWTWRWNHDSMRIPRSIPEAVCPDKCISISGAPDDTLNSLEIHQQILVLKINETRGCLPVYRVETLNVTVGCTCVNPIVVNS
ncbi:interleukin-17F-like [Erpetoichthys calabaricus]|uniref:interleukin-17F-like n=1 Tax=Erpetoichthys calabaricus TaxID=27687 RepID=UPI00109FB405|nr:interleukin-17F-like [Erpetoichthys calabaricus]